MRALPRRMARRAGRGTMTGERLARGESGTRVDRAWCGATGAPSRISLRLPTLRNRSAGRIGHESWVNAKNRRAVPRAGSESVPGGPRSGRGRGAAAVALLARGQGFLALHQEPDV